MHYKLQWAPSNGVGGLRDYAHVRVNQWPVGLPCSPIGQSSSVQLRHYVRALSHNCMHDASSSVWPILIFLPTLSARHLQEISDR